MTLAVIVYAAIFMALVTLLDALFTFVFNKLIG
jgi:preprotein translocase subunit SecE